VQLTGPAHGDDAVLSVAAPFLRRPTTAPCESPTEGDVMNFDLEGYHHLTGCSQGAQEDIDFYTRVLALKLSKQTVLLDGDRGVYHLYYSDAKGTPGTVLTSFPYRQRGIRGRKGSGQVKVVGLSVPPGALGFWSERFARLGVEHDTPEERFGHRWLRFAHPGGLDFELIECADEREPYLDGSIDSDHAIRGVHSVTVSIRDIRASAEFMPELGFDTIGDDGPYSRFELADGGPNRIIDLLHEPDLAPGTWTYAAGTWHHVAFGVASETQQLAIKDHLEGLGYVGVSEIKNRNYFRSIYFRMPAGALFEVTTNGPGFTIDEDADKLGQTLMLPDWLKGRSDQIVADLEPIATGPSAVGAAR
jgi:glyoxalase family protein